MQMILDIQILVTIELSQTAQLSSLASRGLKYLITRSVHRIPNLFLLEVSEVNHIKVFFCLV